MEGFDHILNWKLKAGSHPFPGKHGGTCINEAAIVASGFEYQPVVSVRDMPNCFSRPICKLAMHLNDNANDTERQRLLPFVTQLACADTPAVEAQCTPKLSTAAIRGRLDNLSRRRRPSSRKIRRSASALMSAPFAASYRAPTTSAKR